MAAAAAEGGDHVPRHIKLRSGHQMPTLGLGTFQSYKAADAVGGVGTAVKSAVSAGYRLLDCAQGYGNQHEIGDALKQLFEAKTVQRDEVFVVSKLFQTHHSWDGDDSRCYEMIDQTLADLGLEYLDLLLIHWPFAFAEKVLEKPKGVKQPLRLADGSPNPIWTIKCEYTATWKAMEAMVASGKVRSLGVSNFTVEQLEHLGSVAKVPISVNQVELHPYLPQEKLVEYCKKTGITIMGYSPLGSPAVGQPPPDGPLLVRVEPIAKEVGKTPAQVLVRWALQRYAGALVTIPKSSNPDRIASNAGVYGWSLTNAQMAAVDAISAGSDDFRGFISYLKKADNDIKWHDGKVEKGDKSDFV